MARWQKRLAALPVAAHVAGLAVVLLALLPLVDDGSFSADEGAMLAQVQLLEDTGEWTAPNPAPVLDPELEALPLELSLRTTDGRWAPFTKNVVHVVLVWGATGLLGATGPYVLALLGTVVAAAAGGVLAERVRPGWGWLAVWAAGLATPLLFDSYLVMAHTIGAALVGWAAVAALAAARPGAAARRRAAAAAAACVLVLAAGLVRTEGALAALALGAAVVVGARLGRAGWGAVAAGVAVGAQGPLARLLGGWLDEQAWGGNVLDVYRSGDLDSGWLEGRFTGAWTTWFRPSYGGEALAVLAAVGICLLWATVVLARRRADVEGVRLFAGAATVLVGLLVVAGGVVVPGLLVATPLLAGLAGLRRATVRRPPVVVLGVAGALFVLAVLGTQYSVGGGGEWGGRYFALALPLVVPLAVAGFDDLRSLVPRPSWVATVAAVVATSAVLAVTGVRALDQSQDNATDLVAAVHELRQEVGAPGDPAPVLATAGTVARFAWEHLDEGGWHTVADGTLERYSARLAARGEPVVLYTTEPDEDLPVVEERWRVEPGAGDELFRLTPRQAN